MSPRIGIGRGYNIQRAIIDKNARIGDNVVISPEGKDEEMDGEGFYIRDGIVVIPKNSIIHQELGYRVDPTGSPFCRERSNRSSISNPPGLPPWLACSGITAKSQTHIPETD